MLRIYDPDRRDREGAGDERSGGVIGNAPGARVLVVDDEAAIRRALKTNLMRHGYSVDTAETAAEAQQRLAGGHPDVVLLDLGLPDVDGLDLLRDVRTRSNIPIIVLTARERERDKVEALDEGADDYLTKPFGIDELLARVRVALRHAAGPQTGANAEFVSGELTVNLELRRVRVSGKEVHLSPTEYDLLKMFIAHPNKVLTDRMLLEGVWGANYGAEAHYLHVYMARLRKKIEADTQNPVHVKTEPGVGYRFVTYDGPLYAPTASQRPADVEGMLATEA